MRFKGYRYQLILRALGIAASALLLAYLLERTALFYAPVAVGLTIPLQIAALVRYAEKATRDVNHFLDAVRQADFSQGLASGGRGPLFEQLSRAYADVMDEFREVRAEREEHFRFLQTVVHHVGLALIAFREDGRVELINTAARRLLNRSTLHHIEELRPWSAAFVDTLRQLRAGAHAVVRVHDEEHDLQLSMHAAQFRLRGTGHTLVSIQDIRQELEEQEMAAWQKLTRVLTHEIMNSAAPIASLARTARGLLRAEATGAADAHDADSIRDTGEALEAIQRRSEALMHFADAYRSFSQIRNPNFQAFAVQDLFTQVRRLLRVKLETEGIDFHTHIDPPDLTLTADEELIEQVLINLLLNAMDALEGRPGARLQLRARLDRRGHALIQVADNGPGIPADLQERIFVPFFTTRPDGSGIGLSLSRQIMRLHGGTLGVRSTPEVETVFTLRF